MTNRNSTQDRASHIRQRTAGAALIASGLIFLITEFITAAAWTDPPYSYTHHFISNLGAHGPSDAFGQFMYSPLAWVMNLGFLSFGFAALAGVALLRGIAKRRRIVILSAASLMTFGGVLLSLFPGSAEALENGTAEYHALGAFAAIVGGNLLVIALGTSLEAGGGSHTSGRLLRALGVLGLISLAGFMAMTVAGAGILIGLVERASVYPFLVGFIWIGIRIAKGEGGREASRKASTDLRSPTKTMNDSHD